jgi:4-amino-4-deoxy-L-arabinose transferase-like glycosyltransferase
MTAFLSSWPRTLLCVFLLALLTRGVFILTQQDGFYFLDSVKYTDAAWNLITHGEIGEGYQRAPGYPVFIATVYRVFGETIFAIRAVEGVMGALLAVLMAVIGRRAGGEIVGTLAGITWGLYPMGIFIAGLVYPTGLAAMLLVCAVWCIMPRQKQEFSAKGIFIGGVFFGLAALTIPVALLTIVVVAAWVFYWAGHSRLLLAFLLLLGSALALAPWTARSFMVHGQLVAIQPSAERHLPEFRTAEINEPGSKVNVLLRHPDLYALHVGKQFLRFWELYPDRIAMSKPGYRDKLHDKNPRVVKETIYSPNHLINFVSIMSTGPLFLFALLGTAAMWLKRERRNVSLLLAMTFSFALGYSFFVGRIRYRIPVEPYIIILSAYGVKTAWALLAARFTYFPLSRRADTEKVKTIIET